ncbi:MAG: hypothetical protein KDD69_06440 [Bdellovibrionales bacterium]|nr:hypothetical protein [Bdellovibrionales bacterium]
MLDPATVAAAGAAPRAATQIALYYIPNRILDLIDIFRFDLGVGVSYGGVVRVTRYGQLGFRGFAPRSVRFGIRGRRSPIFVERFPEYGIGPNFVNTGARLPSQFEVGLGLDALLIGAYAGLSFDELVDFFAGLILLDPKQDEVYFR